MAPPEIPEAVRRLIGQHLDSVAQLETLLLLRAAPSKWWSVDEVARAQVSAHDAALVHLAHLQREQLIVEDGGAFRYEPAAADDRTIDALAECYATRRPTVIGLIFAPRDSSAASTLAEGFRFRRRS